MTLVMTIHLFINFVIICNIKNEKNIKNKKYAVLIRIKKLEMHLYNMHGV